MIKPAYSFSFLLLINIFVRQNVLYFLDAPRKCYYLAAYSHLSNWIYRRNFRVVVPLCLSPKLDPFSNFGLHFIVIKYFEVPTREEPCLFYSHVLFDISFMLFLLSKWMVNV